MTRHLALLVAPAVIAIAVSRPAAASPNLAQVAARVIEYGDAYHDEEAGLRRFDEASALVRDRHGRLNVAECSLNYAAALFASGTGPEKTAGILAAVLGQQDQQSESATRGLFRWFAEPTSEYDVHATLYLAPVLAHLAGQVPRSGADRGSPLTESCRLALAGLMGQTISRDQEVTALMAAGALCSLGAVVGDTAAQEKGASLVRQWLAQVDASGPMNGHRPTYDALKIGGLRWAWQNAPNEAARAEAETALQVAYRDLLQRYHVASATVGGAIESAYPADYRGGTSVATYLLGADLPSALEAWDDPGPLTMYFALSDYELSAGLASLAAQRDEAYEVRTRTPAVEETKQAEATSCTYVAPAFTLGTMTGPCFSASIPILATWDVPERPTSYFYLIGAPAYVTSLQSGPVALCSFNFDNVGLARRYQVGVRGVLGARDTVKRVLVNGAEWTGEPTAVSQGSTIALQRGSSYLGLKLLECGTGEQAGLPSGVKPGMLAWLSDDAQAPLMLDVYGRQADYRLRQPLHDVRVGLLVEVAAPGSYESLDDFAKVVTRRRVRQSVQYRKERLRELEDTTPGREHDPKTKREMVFARVLEHSVALQVDDVQLRFVEDLLGNKLMSQTLPVELPPDYLWISPAFSLSVGGSIPRALEP